MQTNQGGRHADGGRRARTGRQRAARRRPFPTGKGALVAAALAVVVVALFAVFSFAGGGPEADEAASTVEAEPAQTAEEELATEAVETALEEPTVSDRVEELLQLPDYPAGCEATSLAIVLRAMGYDVGIGDILDGYLSYDPTWTDAGSYLGDPYTGGGAFPPAVVIAADGFLSDVDSDERATDLTGATFDEIAEIVSSGTPVLVWTTMYQEPPAFSGQLVGDYAWYTNEHCVVVYGVDEGAVLVSDPLEGLVERDYARFSRLFEECGSMAVAIDGTLA